MFQRLVINLFMIFTWAHTAQSLKLLGVASSVYTSPNKWQTAYNISSTTKPWLKTKISLLCQERSIPLFLSLPDGIQSTLESEWPEKKRFLIQINCRFVTWELVTSGPATFQRDQWWSWLRLSKSIWQQSC